MQAVVLSCVPKALVRLHQGWPFTKRGLLETFHPGLVALPPLFSSWMTQIVSFVSFELCMGRYNTTPPWVSSLKEESPCSELQPHKAPRTALQPLWGRGSAKEREEEWERTSFLFSRLMGPFCT